MYTVSATNVWVAGRQGTLLHWDGTSFSAVAIETGEDLRAILTTPVGEVLALSGQAIFVSSP